MSVEPRRAPKKLFSRSKRGTDSPIKTSRGRVHEVHRRKEICKPTCHQNWNGEPEVRGWKGARQRLTLGDTLPHEEGEVIKREGEKEGN